MSAAATHWAIDLAAAVPDLAAKFPKLAKMIAQFRDTQSARSDLTSAFDMIGAIAQAAQAADQGEDWAGRSVPALLIAAIILYSRATRTSSDHRSTLDLYHLFSDTEREAHTWLCNLRDDALAHYGPGPSFGGASWHGEHVLLPLDRPQDVRILHATRRVTATDEVMDIGQRQIHRALMLAQRIAEKREEALVDELNRAMHTDGGLADILNAHKVDMAALFGEHEIGDAIFNGDRISPTRFIWNNVATSP